VVNHPAFSPLSYYVLSRILSILSCFCLCTRHGTVLLISVRHLLFCIKYCCPYVNRCVSSPDCSSSTGAQNRQRCVCVDSRLSIFEFVPDLFMIYHVSRTLRIVPHRSPTPVTTTTHTPQKDIIEEFLGPHSQFIDALCDSSSLCENNRRLRLASDNALSNKRNVPKTRIAKGLCEVLCKSELRALLRPSCCFATASAFGSRKPRTS
jgi:hypothetical protein